MKIENLILLGGLALGAYLLMKKGGLDFIGEAFAGGGGAGFNTGGGFNQPNPTEPGNPADDMGIDIGQESNSSDGNTPVISKAQSWTGVTYGQPGQPSKAFLVNTLREGGPAAAAARALAPPRIVAKIKAGKVF